MALATDPVLNDPKWWRENAPIDATHYRKAGNDRSYCNPWVRISEYENYTHYNFWTGFIWAGFVPVKTDILIERPKEEKGMKGSDKVMVELTGYQVAKLYAVLGSCNGGLEYETRPSLYSQVRDLLGLSSDFWVGHFLNKLPLINFYGLEDKLYKAVLEPETPVLTEVQKKALELKETIAKAQKQLEELEKEI